MVRSHLFEVNESVRGGCIILFKKMPSDASYEGDGETPLRKLDGLLAESIVAGQTLSGISPLGSSHRKAFKLG